MVSLLRVYFAIRLHAPDDHRVVPTLVGGQRLISAIKNTFITYKMAQPIIILKINENLIII